MRSLAIDANEAIVFVGTTGAFSTIHAARGIRSEEPSILDPCWAGITSFSGQQSMIFCD